MAKILHNFATDEKTPHWLKVRAMAIVIGVQTAASKLTTEQTTEYELLNDEDLQRVLSRACQELMELPNEVS